MNSRPDAHDDQFGGPAAEIVAALTNGMRGAFSIGVGMLHSLAAAANANASNMMPFGGMMPQTPGADGEDVASGLRGAAIQIVDIAPHMAEAATVAMASGLRYGQGLAELAFRRQWSLMQAAASPNQCRALVEELRAYLREVSETALLEARRLEQELAQVSENMAKCVEPAVPEASYRRTWTQKP
jgi:hypothetical protein